MTTARRKVALAALLCAAAPACKGKKKSDSETPPPHAAETRSSGAQAPASPPNLPATVALDCARIVPEAVRASYFPGAQVVPTVVGPIATCVFKTAGAQASPSVSLFCHQRKRNWNFASELSRDPHKTAVKDLGRDAYTRGDHVFFYPSKLDCLARVIWPDDAGKATEVARALDPHLTTSVVAAAPSR